MSATRGIADLTSREDGGIVVFVAMLMPVVLLFLALSVDIGNWWVHKRHLQLQVDAAALAGGALFGGCFTDPAGANAAIQNEATRFGGAGGSSYNGQVGGANKGTVSAPLPEHDVRRRLRRGRRHGDAAPLRHAELDVRRQGERGRPASHLPDSRPLRGRRDQRARTRPAETGRGAGRACCRVAVPDLRFTYIFATFVNEATGASLGTVELQRNGTSGNDQLWIDARRDSRLDQLRARRRPAPPRRRHRSERPLRAALHRVLRPRVAERRRPHPRLERRCRAGGPQRMAPPRILRSRTPTSRPSDCSGGLQAEVDLGADPSSHRHRRDRARSGRASTAAARTSSLRAARPASSPGPPGADCLSPAPGLTRSRSSGAGSRPRARGTA